jgi:hypothetical protein
LLEAIRAGQTNVVVTLALALGLTFLGINLLLDIAYRFIDPRLRERDQEERICRWLMNGRRETTGNGGNEGAERSEVALFEPET